MTAAVIDLVAVARARAELAALVAAHPSLTSPEAQARLAATLPELTIMPPRLNPDTTDDSIIIGVRMTPEMRDALDAEVVRQRAQNPDVTIGRSNVLRGIIRRALLSPAGAPAAPAATPAAPSPAPVAAKPLPPPEEPAVAPSKPRTVKPRAPSPEPAASPQLALLGAPEEPAVAPLDLDAPEAQDVSALRADLNAARQRTGLSSRKLAVACGCSDHSVLRFLDGTTKAMPKWADGARAWLASVEPR